MSFGRAPVLGTLVVVAVAALGVGGYLAFRSRDRLPSTDSPAYEEVVRRFYRGLAQLQVGLLDAAKEDFGTATEVVPAEPASWANLGLTHMRLGEFDLADQKLQRAAALAPDHAGVAFLQGQLEVARGRLDSGIALFRRAIELDPPGLRPRFALAQEIERAGGPNADEEAQRQIEQIVQMRPDNLAVLIERARLDAKRGDAGRLRQSSDALTKYVGGWPVVAQEQHRALVAAAASMNTADAARAAAFLRNVLVRLPEFRESLAEVKPPSELFADPFDRFVKLPSPGAMPSPPDQALSFSREPLERDRRVPADVLVALAADGSIAAATNGIAVVDVNRDFRSDLVVAGATGLRLLLQADDGTFPEKGARPLFEGASLGVWASDVEMDGDLDLVVAAGSAAPVVLRNNGDGTWRPLQPFAGVAGLRGFAWGDLDGDGDPDAALFDAAGAVHVFENRQAGEFRRMEGPPGLRQVDALAIGDIDAEGALDLVTLDTAGSIRRSTFRRGVWQQQEVAKAARVPGAAPGAGLFLADLDNNGAPDILVSASGQSRIWLANAKSELLGLPAALDVEVSGILDLNGDGLLDLVGLSSGEMIRLTARGAAGYHWQAIRPRAQPTAGDQRINSFGIGGDIEIRSGLLTQKQVIAGTPVHFGLGARTVVEVTRIVWPNGILQADFDRRADEAVLTEQRLKGSCPWVFADDGTGMKFVTDFLWRSPLGLRINAQDTAGVTQTEDWIRIRGGQLAARDGTYDVRITAELWETHFIDHVSLMAVDHPAGTEIFVDERFAKAPPRLAVEAMRAPRAVRAAWDETGRDVTEIVARQDGRYLATFELGEYQGIARDHFVDVDLGDESAGGRRWLVASGWIYPTDSSINVAIGQGRRVQPRGLSLEAQDASGRWRMVVPDLGFPAGKNKTILIDLDELGRAGVPGARRLRLGTNLEIYWDWLAVASAVEQTPLRTVRLHAERADLRYRGFSQTSHDDRRLPEIPVYGKVANVAQRWRDLVGYYTRFGDVRDLLSAVDDRYVIMNAGDELRMLFRAPEPPPSGWTRDFVLVGDGWEKDGDYNTGFSKTVLPLPSHDRPAYDQSAVAELEEDPVYRRHPQDWQTFHTRFVTPQDFLRGLR